MTASAPIYDLVLLLDLSVEDAQRAKIVSDARDAITADGELLGDQAWGTRALAYEIGHREQAEYHLLQFSGPPSLIAALEHTLRITDGVIRHRTIKLPAGSTAVAATPPPAAPAPAAAPPPAAEPAAPAEPAASSEPAADDPALVSA
jgi:small subunit ribosomal protein S6